MRIPFQLGIATSRGIDPLKWFVYHVSRERSVPLTVAVELNQIGESAVQQMWRRSDDVDAMQRLVELVEGKKLELERSICAAEQNGKLRWLLGTTKSTNPLLVWFTQLGEAIFIEPDAYTGYNWTVADREMIEQLRRNWSPPTLSELIVALRNRSKQ